MRKNGEVVGKHRTLETLPPDAAGKGVDESERNFFWSECTVRVDDAIKRFRTHGLRNSPFEKFNEDVKVIAFDGEARCHGVAAEALNNIRAHLAHMIQGVAKVNAFNRAA